MDTRINNTSVPTSRNNAPANNLPANNVPVAANNAALNTTDAVSITAAENNPIQLQDLGAVVKELEGRIAAMEAQMMYLMGGETKPTNGSSLPPGVSLPPFPGAANAPANNAPANDAPVDNLPANNVPANNAPANNLPANNLPANNVPANNVPANNAPANNAPANNAPATNTPADNADVVGTPTDNATVAGLRGELLRIMDSLKGLQEMIQKRLAELDKLFRAGKGTQKNEAERTELEKRAAGLQTVSHVLKSAKLTGLTPEEEAVVRPALQRVHEIGRLVGEGANPNDHAAELYALKHTLKNPSQIGQRGLVTEASQVVGVINDHKTVIEKRLLELQKHEAETGRLCTPEERKEKVALEAQLKGLIGIEKALDSAKLCGLTKEGEKLAAEAIARLGDMADEVGSGKTDPVSIENEVFKLGQLLKNPDAAVKKEQGQEPESPQVQAGAALIKQIGDAKSEIHERLRDIDDKVIAGEKPEKYAAERQRLLDRAEALTEAGQVIGNVKLDQTTPAGRRAVQEGLTKAAAVVEGLAKGDSPTKHRAELFVLKQTFQEPILSRDNAAIQSGAAALQMIATAEARNIKQQEEISGKIAAGADPRKFDDQVKALHRQHEDLEAIRHMIEGTDFGGLTPEQEARGAKLIDQVRDIAMKVAGGEDFAKHKKAFDGLAKELAALRYWQSEAKGEPTPTPAPTPAPAPTPTPTPTPQPDKPLEPGAMYKVKSGDYLTKIAREKFGDPSRFKDIVELNKDKYPSLVKNPDLIYPGWMLVLPKE